jgi:long-chain acyl-CoA synthetase
VREWAKRKQIEVGPSNADLIQNENVKARIQEEVDFYNQKFGSWEKIKKFELTPDVWSIEGEHLTPTMKLKRRNIVKLYQNLYDGIYEK